MEAKPAVEEFNAGMCVQWIVQGLTAENGGAQAGVRTTARGARAAHWVMVWLWFASSSWAVKAPGMSARIASTNTFQAGEWEGGRAGKGGGDSTTTG